MWIMMSSGWEIEIEGYPSPPLEKRWKIEEIVTGGEGMGKEEKFSSRKGLLHFIYIYQLGL